MPATSRNSSTATDAGNGPTRTFTAPAPAAGTPPRDPTPTATPPNALSWPSSSTAPAGSVSVKVSKLSHTTTAGPEARNSSTRLRTCSPSGTPRASAALSITAPADVTPSQDTRNRRDPNAAFTAGSSRAAASRVDFPMPGPPDTTTHRCEHHPRTTDATSPARPSTSPGTGGGTGADPPAPAMSSTTSPPA
ncbi:hypothetical protein [Saccharothrix texasensis]|uniref:hypothetical protein n=1 Tax=Saccharothrix texasensis TaxID=103734 RepID=UPI000F4C5E6E|nr:hypothetical protein [Saccharothrix texasensis]